MNLGGSTLQLASPQFGTPFFGKIAGLWLLALASALACRGSAPGDPPDPLLGKFTVYNRESPYLVAAPHGHFDTNTGAIVEAFCSEVRWDCLIAEGFRESALINVNRPTEGLRLSEAQFTERATQVYDRYLKRIRRLSPELGLYVELHSQAHAELQDTIDIATVGLSVQDGEQLVRALSEELSAEGLGNLVVRVDVLRDIHYKATHARRYGVLSSVRSALHLELPLAVCTPQLAPIARVLQRALPRVAEAIAPEPPALAAEGWVGPEAAGAVMPAALSF